MTESLVDGNPEPQNYLAELVGEGKKFKDAEALARGKYEADRFIEIKNKQFDDLREDYLRLMDESKNRAKLEDLITQLEGKQIVDPEPQKPMIPNEPTLKPEDIESLVDKRITETERARQQQSNFNVVKAKLEERFGDNYASHVRERVKELGLTADELNDLARRSPNAAINALGLNAQPSGFQNQPVSSVTRKPAQGSQKTWQYYQEMKRTNPKLYTDPKITNEMIQQAETLGDAFYDGDFYN